MIELGKIQALEAVRETQNGVYLNTQKGIEKKDILLPKNQVPEDLEIGDKIEVFVYKDSEDRIIATTKKPKLTVGELAALKVVEVNRIGAFMDWGLDKDLLMPYGEQTVKAEKGSTYFVGLYVDNSERLCATMKVYDLLSTEAPYKVNDVVSGTVYSINKDFGAFVAVENKYHGMIPNKELYSDVKIGDTVEVRITKVREDGKLELSPRKKAYIQMEDDTKIIMDKLKANGGSLALNDSSSPEKIKNELNMSKAAFKRAVGRLMKEGAVKITEDGISLTW
jgi:predicted RNA-binding protein (virulence factor B family)